MKNEIYYTLNVLFLIGCFWCIAWAIYKLLIEPINPFMITELIPLPSSVSCAIPLPTTYAGKPCESTKIDGWSVGHIAIYVSLGLLLPNLWILVLVGSIIFEIFEYYTNLNAKWILDPLTNLFGYALGHIAYIDLHKWVWLSKFNPLLMSICSVVILILLGLIKIYRT